MKRVIITVLILLSLSCLTACGREKPVIVSPTPAAPSSPEPSTTVTVAETVQPSTIVTPTPTPIQYKTVSDSSNESGSPANSSTNQASSAPGSTTASQNTVSASGTSTEPAAIPDVTTTPVPTVAPTSDVMNNVQRDDSLPQFYDAGGEVIVLPEIED